MNAIYFDMDGTIADLYNVNGWLEKLQASDVTPYQDAAPLVDMRELLDICEKFAALGFVIGVISWTAKNGTKEYNKAVRAAKRAWLDAHFPCVDELHVVKYGTPKHRTAKIKGAILVDDNADVRKAWERYTEENCTVDASNPRDLLKNLQNLLDKVA